MVRKVARLQGYKVTRLQGCKVTRLQGYNWRIAQVGTSHPDDSPPKEERRELAGPFNNSGFGS